MSFLDQLQTQVKQKAPSILLYSRPGVGKTSFAAEFPNCLFMIDDQEDGINDLKQSGLVRPDIPVAQFNNWPDGMNFLDELRETKHPYKWLVMDGWTGFERLLHLYVTETKYGGDGSCKGFLNFGNGYKESLPYVNAMALKMAKLTEMGTGVIILAHSRIRSFNDPVNGQYDKIYVDCNEKACDVLSKWVTIQGYMESVVSTRKAEDGKKQWAEGGYYRQLHVNGTAVFDAKNRSNVVAPIPMGTNSQEAYRNFMLAFKTAKQQNMTRNTQPTVTQNTTPEPTTEGN